LDLSAIIFWAVSITNLVILSYLLLSYSCQKPRVA